MSKVQPKLIHDQLSVDSATAKVSKFQTAMTLGKLLVYAGKIKNDDINRILSYTKQNKIRFGDAAIRLKLVNEADIKQALATQYSYHYLERNEGGYNKCLVAAYKPFSKQVEVLRVMRTQLMLRYFNHNKKLLMISSAEAKEGKSYTAANLAIVFSQLGENTLLIDANLRQPTQCKFFKLDNKTGLTTILSDRDTSGVIKVIPEFKSLSVLTSGPIPPNPSELLSNSRFKNVLDKLELIYDVILLDTSSASDSTDNEIIAAQVGAVMTIANKNKTSYEKFEAMIKQYESHNIDIVGSVLNNF